MNKKVLIILLLALLIFLLGFMISLLTQKRISLPEPESEVVQIPLPQNPEIGQYLQTKIENIDQDEKKELIAIYHDQGSEHKLFRVYLAIFKQKDNQWEEVLNHPLEGFTLYEEVESSLSFGRSLNQFLVADLTGDGIGDVLVKTRSTGSGMWFGIHIFGLNQAKELVKLASLGPAPHGEGGITQDKVWLLIPEYQPEDPNCCPSLWSKVWLKWNGTDFAEIKRIQDPEVENLKKTGFND